MSRRPTPSNPDFPLHLTAACNNRDWFYSKPEDTWQIFKRSIYEAREKHGFKTFAFLMMGNHYHWLMKAPLANLGEGMHRFQNLTSKRIAGISGRVNRIYGGRYKPTLIETPRHFKNAVRYIYQNPLRAGIAERAEKYPWSSLSDSSFIIDPFDDFGVEVPNDPKTFLKWVNEVPSEMAQQLIKKAMHKPVFRIPRIRNSEAIRELQRWF